VKYVLDANAAIAAMNGGVPMVYGENRAALEAKGVVKSDFTSDRGLLDDSIPGLRAENWLE